FWIDSTISGESPASIMTAPKDGSASPRSIADNQNRAVGLNVQDGYVYWTTSFSVGQILRCPTTGCAPSGPESLIDHRPFPNCLWIDSRAIIWRENYRGADDVFQAAAIQIFACQPSDCRATSRLLVDGIAASTPAYGSPAWGPKVVADS